MFLVMTIKDGVPDNPTLLTTDREAAQNKFIETCEREMGKKLSDEDKNHYLDQGYMGVRDSIALSTVTVTYLDLSNTEGHDSVCPVVIHCPDEGCGGITTDGDCDHCGDDWKRV